MDSMAQPAERRLLIDLPTEIIFPIVELLSNSPRTLKALRLTHSSLGSVATSVLFERWTLSIGLFTLIPSPNPREVFSLRQHEDLSIDEDEEPPYRHGATRNFTKQEVDRSLVQAAALRRAYEDGSSAALQVLHENVQELIIRRYDLFEPYPGGQGRGVSNWSRYSDWGIAVLKKFLSGMKKLQVIEWDMPISNLSAAMDTPSITSTVTTIKSTCDVAEWYANADAKLEPCLGLRALTNLTTLELLLMDAGQEDALNSLPHLAHLTLEATKDSLSLLTFLDAQTVPFKLRTLTLKNEIKALDIPDEVFTVYLSDLETLNLPPPEDEICRVIIEMIDRRGQELDDDDDDDVIDDPEKIAPYLIQYTTIDGPYTPIWTHLSEHGIYLTDIRTYGQSPALISYLLSYPPSSSLECLDVKVWPYMTRSGVDVRNFVETLWSDVVPRHKDTLKRLGIYPDMRFMGRGGNIMQTVMTEREERRIMADMVGIQETVRGENQPMRKKVFGTTDEIAAVVSGCKNLEHVALGSTDSGFGAIIWTILQTIKWAVEGTRLRTMALHLDGWGRLPEPKDLPGFGMAHFAKKWSEVRRMIMKKGWDMPEGGTRGWEKMKITIVPMEEMWFVKGKEEGTLNLMDHKYEKEIEEKKSGDFRTWRSVYDLLPPLEDEEEDEDG
ncbi:hypothetical protein H072_6615 [Dactylellina haptotyla CBS 200.50]|uniref:Uncharacterized protein n=1 Tax=Dactylellina haptotyla (strain CBS 200.50) TaxID=1284197 RepID=S8BWA2_DACHA|nr:hypothetical protein H072_6615 [Dactylellina haptotyla CBS 200.50]